MDKVVNQKQSTIKLIVKNIKPQKKYLPLITTSLLLIIMLNLIYVALNQQKQISNLNNQKPITKITNQANIVNTNTSEKLDFDMIKIKVGDTIASMKVISIFSENPTTNTPFRGKNVRINLKGEIILEGRFHYSQETIDEKETIETLTFKFYSNRNSNINFSSNLRITNLEIAKKLLKINKNEKEVTGRIKIIIDEYSIGKSEDTAKLIKVLKSITNSQGL
jgi:predicted DNA-binding ribbon-helix-helix protein